MGPGDTAGAPAPCSVSFTVGAACVPRFFLLLQQGARIRRRVGCPLEEFLRQEIGASRETIGRIQSIFLDGRPVDDIAAAVVLDGSTLALSAALPGLVGATLRRGGAYSSFRSGITHREHGGAGGTGTGWVTVKLFNLTMEELGPGLLQEGVQVGARDLLDLLPELPRDDREGAFRIAVDGTPVEREALAEELRRRGADRVLLSVFPARASSGRDA